MGDVGSAGSTWSRSALLFAAATHRFGDRPVRGAHPAERFVLPMGVTVEPKSRLVLRLVELCLPGGERPRVPIADFTCLIRHVKSVMHWRRWDSESGFRPVRVSGSDIAAPTLAYPSSGPLSREAGCKWCRGSVRPRCRCRVLRAPRQR